jgi:hypothetical protein
VASHHRTVAFLMGMLLVCACLSAAIAAPPKDGLSGTWQVTRKCVSGCSGTTSFSESVRALSANVFQATGRSRFVLYRTGTGTVLAHSSTSSLLLTVRTRGVLMDGPGVDQGGMTFVTTWRCTATATYEKAGGSRPASRLRPIC